MHGNEVRAYAHAMIHTAATWDVLGAFGMLPLWWPPVSYVLVAAGIAAACVAVLVGLLTAPRGARPRAARTAGQLLAVGILLAAWLLRGDAEIPPDPPLVAAGVAGAALFAAFTLRRSRPAAGGRAAEDSP